MTLTKRFALSMNMSPEDAALDRLWRRKFDQPLPILGAHETVRAILKEHGVGDDEMVPIGLRKGARKSANRVRRSA